MLFVILGLVLSIFGLSGCSSVPNTIAGLSTLQSTISGSNYVFFVEPSSGRLTPSLKRGTRRADSCWGLFLSYVGFWVSPLPSSG